MFQAHQAQAPSHSELLLQASQLNFQAAAAHIVRDVSLQVARGQFVGLLGPNGSGKSTLLRMIYRILRPASGTVCMQERDVWRHSAFDKDSAQDFAIVAQSLTRVQAQPLAERMFSTLSGGEKQRVLMARALAQQAPLLVLDEPTNHLDVRHQFELMNLIRGLSLTTLAALHELPLAAHYCDRIYLLQHGALVAQGTPNEVLTPETIARVYGVRAQVHTSARTGKPVIEFMPDELL